MTFDNEDFDTDSMHKPPHPRFDLDSPVLFGRGVWIVNGQTIYIEQAGWRQYYGGHWVPCEDPFAPFWKPIPGYESFYEISDRGEIRRSGKSQSKFSQTPKTPIGHILRPTTGSNGYSKIQLWNNGKGRWHLVHRLVMRAFVGDCPADHQVNHRNGNRSDNHLNNLEYVTCQANHRHKIDVLGSQRGETHSQSKINNNDVRRIRELRESGVTYPQLEKMFPLSRAQLWLIANRKAWRHVSG